MSDNCVLCKKKVFAMEKKTVAGEMFYAFFFLSLYDLLFFLFFFSFFSLIHLFSSGKTYHQSCFKVCS